MGKKSTPQAPAAPDPVATAAAQATANKESAVAQANLNRIDQYTPQGSLTYQQTGVNADGTPKFQQTQSYSPEQQKIYDQETKLDFDLNALAGNNVQRVNNAQSTPFSYDGMTPLQTGVQAGPIRTSMSPGTVQTAFGTGPDVTRLSGTEGGNVQTWLDFSGATKLPGTNDFGVEAQKQSDAVYGQLASRLDPQFSQQESDFKSRLANSGITENSDAYRRELDNFSRDRNDAYGQARYTAQQAGADEQSRLFGLALTARQQGVGETAQQGAFANDAQKQILDQATSTGAFNNDAQSQQYTQNMGAAEFGNNATNQQFQMGQQAVATDNTAQNQQFNQNLTNTNLNNAGRQQQIDEATYLRNLPLNEIAALMGTGGSVQNPTFNPVSQVGVAAPDYQGAVYANYNAANQQYQAAQQARSQGLGSIFGLAGSIGSAAMMASDRRLKHNIERVGTLANGLATYVFSYIGSTVRHFGVMAQEVLGVVPDAVLVTPSGYMAVDYRKVW